MVIAKSCHHYGLQTLFIELALPMCTEKAKEQQQMQRWLEQFQGDWYGQETKENLRERGKTR